MATMAGKSTFPLYDRILNGELEQKLRDWRGAGLSYVNISRELDKYDIHVDFNTVAKWLADLGITKPEKVG